jgi:hypothetical protein
MKRGRAPITLSDLPNELLTEGGIGPYLDGDDRWKLSEVNKELRKKTGAPFQDGFEAAIAFCKDPAILYKIKRGELYHKDLLDSPRYMLKLLSWCGTNPAFLDAIKDCAGPSVLDSPIFMSKFVRAYRRETLSDRLDAIVGLAGPSVLRSKTFVDEVIVFGAKKTVEKIFGVMGTNLLSDLEFMLRIAEQKFSIFLKSCALAQNPGFMVKLLNKHGWLFTRNATPDEMEETQMRSNKEFMTAAVEKLGKREALKLLDRNSSLCRDPEFLWVLIEAQ